MAKVLQIENFAATTTINLADDASLCAYFGEAGNRPLTIGGNVTRVFRFRATSTTKALARANVNAFILALRKALIWGEDDLIAESWFLREAADGETPVRSLILGFEASAVSEGSAIDAYQTMNTALYVDVALTLQNHREAVSSAELTTVDAVGASIGKSFTYSTAVACGAKSRIQTLAITAGSNITDKFWVGMMPYQGADFQYLWELDNGTAGTDTVKTGTTSGKFSTNTIITNFADALMARRLAITVYDQYTAASSTNYNQARGRYVALLRYQMPASNTVLARIGIYSGLAAYNEPRLLVADGVWHFANMGVVSFPAGGYRHLTGATKANALQNTAIYLDAQQLSGTGDLIMDTITLIPYESYISISNGYAVSAYVQYIITHEDFKIETFAGTYTGTDITKWGTVEDQNNWSLPIPSRGLSNYIQAVIATETAALGQVAADSITTTIAKDIVPGFEAYYG